jgi:hypothetical protein
MLKSAVLTVMLVAAPAFAQEAAPRTDFATLQKLATQAAKLVQRQPADLTLGVAQVSLCDEVAQAMRTERARPTRLKVAPHF